MVSNVFRCVHRCDHSAIIPEPIFCDESQKSLYNIYMYIYIYIVWKAMTSCTISAMNNFNNCPRECALSGEPLNQDIVMYLLVIMIIPRKQYKHISWGDKENWLTWIKGVRYTYTPIWKSNQTLRIKSVTSRKYYLCLLVTTIPLGLSHRKCSIMGRSHCCSLTQWR